MLLADINLADLMWGMLLFFFFMIILWMIFGIIGDIFRSDDLNGWAKTFWCFFLIVFPWLMIFIYLIVRGNGMSERALAANVKAQQQFNDYARQVSTSSGNATDEIANAKALLDSGALTQAEFDQIKAKALA